MFKPFTKTIVLITLITLASACEPTVPPTPASTSTNETPIIAPTITPMPPVNMEQVAVLDLPDSIRQYHHFLTGQPDHDHRRSEWRGACVGA